MRTRNKGDTSPIWWRTEVPFQIDSCRTWHLHVVKLSKQRSFLHKNFASTFHKNSWPLYQVVDLFSNLIWALSIRYSMKIKNIDWKLVVSDRVQYLSYSVYSCSSDTARCGCCYCAKQRQAVIMSTDNDKGSLENLLSTLLLYHIRVLCNCCK